MSILFSSEPLGFLGRIGLTMPSFLPEQISPIYHTLTSVVALGLYSYGT
jgi:hypothetical protein